MKSFYLLTAAILSGKILVAQCTADLSIVQDGNTVSATLTGDGAATESFTINWGDGTFDFTATAEHTYAADGEYEICGVYLDSENAFECYVQDCEPVVIGSGSGACTMTFDTFITGMTVGATVSGSGAATPGYSIDWGDGTTPSTGSDAAFHTYTEAGVYSICVTYYDIDDEANCTVTSCQEVTITESKSDCSVEITVTIDGNTVTVTSVGTGAEQPTYGIGWGDGSFPTLNSTGAHTYANGGTYNICVTYLDLANAQTCSATDCEEVIISGVEELLATVSNLHAMPNPMSESGIIEFTLSGSTLVQVELFDITGKKVKAIFYGNKSQGQQKLNWSAGDLESGIYFLRLIADGQVQTTRVVKK
ncbi:MAG: T9SS type A sorting domain-containing protein [Flavobacteriales bacterium]